MEAIRFLLSNSNAGLWFSPGCGKTSCVLAAFLVLLQKGMTKRMLVVAPPRVATVVWPDEKQKWSDFAGLRMVVLHGNPDQRDRLISIDADIYVCSPETFKDLVSRGLLANLNADIVVFDESSDYRNHMSGRFKMAKTVLSTFKRRITLTGTPAPNGYLNLWAQSYLMDMGGALERYVTHYRNKYFVDLGYKYPDWHLKENNAALIDERLKPLVLREDAVDHLDMPALIENIVPVAIPPAARSKYDRMEKDYVVMLDSGDEAAALSAAALGTKLRQISSGFVYKYDRVAEFIHDAKLIALTKLLEGLNGQPVLIFYEFVEDKHRLSQMLGNAVSLSDLTPVAMKAVIDRFNAGQIQHLLAHPASAGWGLNLQGSAQHVVWYGPTWNLEHKQQATARVWRQGNPHDRVFVHTLVVENSLESKVAGVLAEKDATQASLLAAMKRAPAPDCAAA
jgi:SNF2 family DNA or RNA helicase